MIDIRYDNNYQILILYIRYSIGTWNSGVPSTLDIEEDFRNETAEFRPKKIFRVVTVLQPPLMDWNQEQGEEKIMIKLTYVLMENIISETYEGFCFDLLNHMADILK